MAKIKIDIMNGLFEAEGDEQFIREMYQDFQPRKQAGIGVGSPKKSNGEIRSGETYPIMKDINLSMDRITLKQFYQEKNPTSALERNAVFVYFLERILELEKISIGHIYTCYKDLGIKPPAKLRQSLADTSSKKGWLLTGSMNDLKITPKGDSFVEHELPVL